MGNKSSQTKKATRKEVPGEKASKQLTPHAAAKATARDAIAAFGAGYGYLLEPVEWRVTASRFSLATIQKSQRNAS